MPKENETSLEFKKRVMDKVSSSFCAAKWFNATIWLNLGRTTSCHHPPAHDVVVKDILKNPSALHNTIEKKRDREMMLKGERPAGCEYCWKIEDMGPDFVSDRIFKTNIYDEKSLEKIGAGDPHQDIDLKTLEISFDRKCNFACCYCNPDFSTQWSQDIKRSGPYVNLEDVHAENFATDSDHYFPYENSPINPYLLAFWKWWPKLSQSLQELRVTGGEPLLSQDFWELIRLMRTVKREDMHFAVNTNLGLSPHYIDKLIESSHDINNFHIYTSCETVGKHAEYIRDGLDYGRFKENIVKVSTEGKFKSLNIMMTINALCLFGITDFLDQILEWKGQYGKHFPTFTMNMLRFPSFMSALTMPDHIKENAREKLKDWHHKNRFNPLTLPHELESIERLINYLEKVQQVHERARSREIAQKDFRTFFDQYDKRRNKSITEIFPKEFAEWYLSLPKVS